MAKQPTTVKYFIDYSVKENNDKETIMLETERFSNIANAYMREITIQKDNYFLTTWFNSLGDNELVHIHNLMKTVMAERGINA